MKPNSISKKVFYLLGLKLLLKRRMRKTCLATLVFKLRLVYGKTSPIYPTYLESSEPAATQINDWGEKPDWEEDRKRMDERETMCEGKVSE